MQPHTNSGALSLALLRVPSFPQVQNQGGGLLHSGVSRAAKCRCLELACVTRFACQ